MRVFLFSSPGWGSMALERLLAQGHEVVGLCCRASASISEWRMITRLVKRLAGSIGASRATFYYRDPLAEFPHPYQLARRYGIPWVDPELLSTQHAAEALRRVSPDVGFVCGFSKWIPPAVYQVPAQGTINFHPSLLPAHRGGTPTRWIILRGERLTGVTAHHLTEQLDAGDILCSRSLSILDGEDWGTVEVRLVSLAASIMGEVASALEEGRRYPAQPQGLQGASYERPFRQTDSVIDWHEPLATIVGRCLAAKPKWGGLFGLHKAPLCAWSVECGEGPAGAVPGTVTQIIPGALLDIACPDGLLRVTHLLSVHGTLTVIPSRWAGRMIRPGDRCTPSLEVRSWFSQPACGDGGPRWTSRASGRETVDAERLVPQGTIG